MAYSLWKPRMARLFISHSVEHKSKAKELASALEPYGVSSFVAHDTIEPMAKWQEAILEGLETMDIMLAFVTDGFHKSYWTNQEIGFALARNIPVLSLKLQQSDPKGFIAREQALIGTVDDPAAAVPKVYESFWSSSVQNEKLKKRLQRGLIGAFVGAWSFEDAKKYFDYMDKFVDYLSDDERAQIIKGFADNNQLRDCWHVQGHLPRFLKRMTGKSYVIKNDRLSCGGRA